MTKALLSQILSVGIIALACTLIITIILFLVSRNFRAKLLQINYYHYLTFIGILSTISTISVLIYQYYFGVGVCELCWWQRIFMFPIEFIVLSSIIKKSRGNHFVITLLSIIGAAIAAYHYYDHLKLWVFKTSLIGMQCTGAGGSCSSTSGVMTFGFISLPGMALVVFLTIIFLAFLAGRREKHTLLTK